MNSDRSSILADRLESLETQIARLGDLLAEQSAAKRRRRRITIRMLMCLLVGFACLFAWFANHYQRSQMQARAVDRLIDQNAFVMYQPADSLLVSLLPGDANTPPRWLAKLLGDDFFRSPVNVSTAQKGRAERQKNIVLGALPALTNLKLLRLTNLSLRTADLFALQDLPQLQSLDLTRTGLDSGSMPWLSRLQLRWLNVSHTQFSDRALQNLARSRELQYLNLERTTVSDDGLSVIESMPNLRYLNLKRCPVSLPAVRRLSKSMPNCLIEYEPLQFRDGKVDRQAAQSGRLKFGVSLPVDPRVSKQARAPMDHPVNNNQKFWYNLNQPQRYNNGYILDVF